MKAPSKAPKETTVTSQSEASGGSGQAKGEAAMNRKKYPEPVYRQYKNFPVNAGMQFGGNDNRIRTVGEKTVCFVRAKADDALLDEYETNRRIF